MSPTDNKPPRGRAARKNDIEARDDLIELLEGQVGGGILTQARRVRAGDSDRERELRAVIERHAPKPKRIAGARGGNRRGLGLEVSRLLRQCIDDDMRASGFTNAKEFLSHVVPMDVKPKGGEDRQKYIDKLYRYYKRGKAVSQDQSNPT